VTYCSLSPHFISYITGRTNYISMKGDVRFVLDQYAELVFIVLAD